MENKSDTRGCSAPETARRVVLRLIEEGRTISVMESCTAGLIASMITDTEGASEIFPGGFVTYSNHAKEAAGVDGEIIRKYGVYSAECARAMAETAKERFSTDIGVGITGTTGNTDPYNGDSVRGKAYFCVAAGEEARSYEIDADVDGLDRHEIKGLYAARVFEALDGMFQGIYQSEDTTRRKNDVR